jgi:hypothetical protein
LFNQIKQIAAKSPQLAPILLSSIKGEERSSGSLVVCDGTGLADGPIASALCRFYKITKFFAALF